MADNNNHARNPVGWFEIYVNDMERAKAFYEDVLKRKLDRLEMPDSPDSPPMEMWALPMEMDAPGAAGALVKMEGVPSGPGGTMIYFSCEDCAVEASRVEEAGGKLRQEKTSIGQYGHMALAVDTEGNMIGLHSMK